MYDPNQRLSLMIIRWTFLIKWLEWFKNIYMGYVENMMCKFGALKNYLCGPVPLAVS